MRRIAELEAVRGLLALWVVVGHVIKHSGYTDAALGPLHLLAQPGYAVDIFIILSGFVIFHLLDAKPASYAGFIVQRFFRLFPLFLAVLIAAAFTLPGQIAWASAFPWQTDFIRGYAEIAKASYDHLPAQFAAHLTMLHGLIPNALLPYSEYAIVGQAWSISVEWQFYLVAPLLFMAATRRRFLLCALLIALLGLKTRYWLGEGFAVNQLAFFAVGIASFFLCRSLLNAPGLTLPGLCLATVAFAVVAYIFGTTPVSLVLWAGLFGLVIAVRRFPEPWVRALAAPLHGRAVQWLGKISYSVYLTHFVLLYLISAALLRFAPALTEAGHACALMALTVGATIAVSSATYVLIEAPFIAVGHRLGGLLDGGNRRFAGGPEIPAVAPGSATAGE